MALCYIGLGSNLRGPERQLRQAISHLRKLPHTIIHAQSSIYLSKPCGVRSQPTFFNMVIALQTSLPATDLLRHCQAIEKKQMRVHKKHWGARTLDIDIILYDHKKIQTPKLKLPHPEMLKRDFVLVPLLEIAPETRLPNGLLLSNCLSQTTTYLLKTVTQNKPLNTY